MKYISHMAVLLTLIVSNTAMWGQISRTVSFDLNSRHESDYCLGANTNEFTLTIDTKLESIDSLQAYDLYIRFDEKKIRITAGLRPGTISSQIPQNNFFFGMDTIGLAKVFGYLNFKAGNLVGNGALVALRGEWINSTCPDSTVCKIEFFDPGFEFGIGPRFVKVDSSVKIFNRVYDTVNTIIQIKSPSELRDSLNHLDTQTTFSIKSEVFCGKATTNDTVLVDCLAGDSLLIEKIVIDSVRDVQASIRGTTVVLTKQNRGIAGYLAMRVEGKALTRTQEAQRKIEFSTKTTSCDCVRIKGGAETTIKLFRRTKPDTVSSVREEIVQVDRCTDYYDILGRFIESDCPNDGSTKAIRRKALKLGNDYIQYIESK